VARIDEIRTLFPPSSIRINRQWRICFNWPDGSPGPTEIEIVDYHD
jgi:plasmid maintenance system killer protein